MPGFGIQKRGTSPLLVKRKKFEEGGIAGETEDGVKVVTDSSPNKKLPPEVSRNMTPLKPDKNIPESKIPNEDLSKEKPSKEGLQFRCGTKGKRKEMKKGGLTKIAKDLKKSSSMHLKQSKTLDKLLKKSKK